MALPGLALESGLPSKTAILAAASRAIASRDPQTRCPDSIAGKFIERKDFGLARGIEHSRDVGPGRNVPI